MPCLRRVGLHACRAHASVPTSFFFLLLAFLTLLSPAGVRGQSGDTLVPTNLDFEGARGHITNNAFFAGTEIDSVNTRTGNLVVKIPLGQRFQVGPSFQYGLDLVCNSNAWDVITTQSGSGSPLTYPVPNFGTNAGPGCRVSLGMLYPSAFHLSGEPVDWPNQAVSPWLLESPDGSKIYFDCRGSCSGLNGTFYSNNGTFLRLTASTATGQATVEFGNGQTQTFRRSTFACSTGECWRPTRMEDSFGNGVTVTYDNTPVAPRWILGDDDGRVTRLNFLRGSAAGGSTNELGDLKMVLDSVDVPAFDGQRAIYGFNYQEHTISRSCPVPATAILPLSIPVLTSVDLPEPGYRYRFTQHLPGPPGAGGCSYLSGLITAVDLPTNARIAYDYGNYFSPSICSFPPGGIPDDGPEERIRSVGVQVREVYKHFSDSAPLTWEVFSQRLDERAQPPRNDGPGDCNRDNLSITEVVAHPAINGKYKATRYYHTVTRQEDDVPPTGPWAPEYYGLPITLNTSQAATTDFGGTVYLSREVAACSSPTFDDSVCDVQRSTYLKYAVLPRGCSPFLEDPSCFRDEAVVQERRQTYGLKHIDTRYLDYDGYGHFKRSKVKSDMSASPVRRTFTRYTLNPNAVPIDGDGIIQGSLPLPPVTAPWLLNLHDLSYDEIRNRREVREREFDPATGFLRCERARYLTLASDSSNVRHGNDVATRFYPSADGRGFITSERTAGGDGQTLTTTQMCPTTGFEYRLDHLYQFSRRRHSRWKAQNSTAVGPPILDLTIDRNTGSSAASRDHGASPALETTFDYDLLGRKTSETTVAGTEIAYTLTGTGSRVDVTTRSQGGTLLSDLEFTFDQLGREVRLRAQSESGPVRQDKLYHAQGWLLRETSFQPEATFDGGYRRRYLSYDIFGRVGWIDDSNLGTQQETRFQHFGGSIHRSAVRRKAKIDGVVGWLRSETSRDAYGRPTQELGQQFPQGSPAYRIVDSTYVGNRTVRKLRDPSDSQSQERTEWTDGRGFRYKELLPEKEDPVVYRYDSRGNLIRRSEGSVTLTYAYDRAGRLRTVKRGADLLKEYVYDAQGNVQRATRYNAYDPANTFGYTEAFASTLGTSFTIAVEDVFGYNGLGRVASKNTRVYIVGLGADLRKSQQSWLYDDLGRITRISYPSCTLGCAAGVSRNVHKEYRFGFLDRLRMGTGSNPPTLVEQDYHANGVPKRIAFFRNGNLETYTDIETEASGLPRIRNITVRNAAGAALVTTGSYTYDLLGYVSSIASPSATLSYDYDRAGRLVTVRNGPNPQHGYEYDLFDNLLRLDDGSAVTVDAASNRLIAAGGDSVSYDSRGRMTSWGRNHMSWDDVGRQIAWSSDRPAPSTDWLYQAVYVYDVADRRVMTFDRTREATVPGNYGGNYAVQVFTVRDLDGKPLRDFRKLPAVPPQSGFREEYKDYVWDGRHLRAVVDDGALRFAHLDHLGSVRILSSGGTVAQLNGESFKPFGDKYARTSRQRIAFSGHELDRNLPVDEPPDQEKDGLGLSYNMGARQYLQDLGRFASPDPARDGWNLYAYAGNNPINFVDPTGLRTQAADTVEEEEEEEELARKREEALRRIRRAISRARARSRVDVMREITVDKTPILVQGLFETLTGVPMDEAMAPRDDQELARQVIVGNLNLASNLSTFAAPGLGTVATKQLGARTLTARTLFGVESYTSTNVTVRSMGRFGYRRVIEATCGSAGPCGHLISPVDAVFLNRLDDAVRTTYSLTVSPQAAVQNLMTTTASSAVDQALPDP